jgi:ABC-type branched-subunit amino acid transport system permease subunit
LQAASRIGTFAPVRERHVRGVIPMLPKLAAGGLVLFGILYVVAIAQPAGEFGGTNWRSTNFGSAIDDPASFVKVLLDAVTFAGLLFIVASGFSLIFGLMRVVNMAHGSFYLLGGYIAYEIQQSMNPEGQGYSLQPFQVSTWEWLLPLIVTVGCIARRSSRSPCRSSSPTR